MRTAVESPWGVCRVTLYADGTAVDLALPDDVPIAALLPALRDIAHRQGVAVHHLAAPGLGSLDPGLTLRENGIRDGTVLTTLVVAGAVHRPRSSQRRQHGAVPDAVFAQRQSRVQGPQARYREMVKHDAVPVCDVAQYRQQRRDRHVIRQRQIKGGAVGVQRHPAHTPRRCDCGPHRYPFVTSGHYESAAGRRRRRSTGELPSGTPTLTVRHTLMNRRAALGG